MLKRARVLVRAIFRMTPRKRRPAKEETMSTVSVHRDYGLLGPESEKAAAAGLVSAKWYAPNISRIELKELMKREDAPAIRDTLIWIAALILSGGLGWWFWGSWTAVPFFIVYGVLYGSASDSRWHECGHRTAFKTVWMNDAVYELACFMILREPEIWRWSHTRHHTDTIIVGRDPEIITPRPPDVVSLILNIFALKNAALFLRSLFIHARGRLTEEEKDFRSRKRAAKSLWYRWYLSRHLCPGRRRLRLVPIDPASHVCRPAVSLRLMAAALFRLYAASRVGGGRARSPA
jgi:Fatty acid desaturase